MYREKSNDKVRVRKQMKRKYECEVGLRSLHMRTKTGYGFRKITSFTHITASFHIILIYNTNVCILRKYHVHTFLYKHMNMKEYGKKMKFRKSMNIIYIFNDNTRKRLFYSWCKKYLQTTLVIL